MPALTVYSALNAAADLGSATQLQSTAPAGSETANNNACTTAAFNWGELQSRNAQVSWPNLGAEPTPTGKGFLWDVTTLEGQTIAAGNWSGTWDFRATAGTITATIYCRLWKWNKTSGIYTQIGSDINTGSRGYTSSTTAVSIPSTAMPATAFLTADKLYIDFVANIATVTNNANFIIFRNQSAGTADLVVTPGYAASPKGLPPGLLTPGVL